MSPGELVSGRARKLTALFWKYLDGTSTIKNAQDAKHFLEASNIICSQKLPAFYVESIISSARGVETISSVVRSDLSSNFVLDIMTLLIKHLSDPAVKTINNGSFLKSILLAVLSPPTFWSALLGYHQAADVGGSVAETFAWLCLEIVASKCHELEVPYNDVVALMSHKHLIKSSSHSVRRVAYRIEKVLSLCSTSSTANSSVDYGPGGRHDNDFSDFRAISLYPTADEMRCTDEPFLQRLDDVFEGPRESRAADYLSWLFRLLREDMLADMREDLAIAWGDKKGRRKPLCLAGLSLVGFGKGDKNRGEPLALKLACKNGIVFPRVVGLKDKKKFLSDSKSFMKHSAIGVLCRNNDIVAFGSLIRNIDLMITQPPTIVIKFTSTMALKNAIREFLGDAKDELRFFVVDTATFAYEPILKRLAEIVEIPLEDTLLDPKSAMNQYQPPLGLSQLLEGFHAALEQGKAIRLPSLAQMGRPVVVSGAQLESLTKAIENCVSQIQGPPGTGKSFIGALISQLILRHTNYRILVLSYTNHALDQFLEELLDIMVPEKDMVRIGSKSTPRTAPLRLETLAKQPAFRFSYQVNAMIRKLKAEESDIDDKLAAMGAKLAANRVDTEDVLAMLEFSENWASYWLAFQVPRQDDGFEIMGKKNKPMQPSEVLDAWGRGRSSRTLDALIASMDSASRQVLEVPVQSRMTLVNEWRSKVRHDQVEEFVELAKIASNTRQKIESLFNESKRKVLQSKRVIGCTTTAAAMYQSIINSAEPDVVLVEEAGEILEAHVITALGSSVKQLVLIGDHKQLRPKVNNYNLTLEKGDGFNLNVSLFERLIQQGHSYTTLGEQHRSLPEISFFTRRLAYEHLEDHPKTLQRSKVKGLKKRVVFVHHENHEDVLPQTGDRRPGESKRNAFEAKMVLKTVRYLNQQGYTSKNMVVLTPYLGQLSLLRQQLSNDHDPWLNDLDSYELTRAGLMSPVAAQLGKQPLRLSTIDNYQGEESDIVIASLTRSNASGDIGFMAARERLVVLMSRAREGIILFGNMHTFTKSKRGGEMWRDFFQALKDKECLFDGVPVYCERHPDREAILKSTEDFDQHCPDGGCAEPCGEPLSCGKHPCERRCHWVIDHSQTPCYKLVPQMCERGHKWNNTCSAKSAGCKMCAREDEETRRRAAQDLELEELRQEKQAAYASQLLKIRDEIDHHQRVMAFKKEEDEQQIQLKDSMAKLEALKEAQKRHEAAENSKKRAAAGKTRVEKKDDKGPASKPQSRAQEEWQAMKAQEEVSSEALNKLMDLIGLDAAKEEFLSVKSNVDTKIRQGVSLSEERLSCTLLGNPGTGKTTVARLWGEFLAWTGALPGSGFKETWGSKLANIGVSGCEKLLQELKDDGGGVLFIDEAYQLSSGHSPGGKAVLDYLLAEVENLRGKISFVIAGYAKQMETFFSHNPGFSSRFPIEIRFEDYSDDELLQILQRQVDRKFRGNMAAEDGFDGLYLRIAARRIGRGRGKEGFANARAVENALARIDKRQSTRLRRERRSGGTPNDYLLTKEDIIGPEPCSALKDCQAWETLNKMIGLDEVKQEVKILLDSLMTNYQRELDEEPLMAFSLNRVFIGSPGTGKTTVAKLYGQILVSLGMLSNGEVVVKTPADFIGSALGQSEAQTKGILASTVGKVLVIDEAYGLLGDAGSSGSHVADPYRTAVVDTIVAEVQNVPGEDRCVLLLGYKDQMEDMFQSVNPGLSRRFAIDSPFVFQDFDDDALSKIMDLKLNDRGFRATGQAKRVALEILARERNRPHFGNGGAVDNILSKALGGYQKRLSAGKAKPGQLEAIDFDADFDRSNATDVGQLFAGDIGREKVISLLQGIQDRVQQLKSLDMDVGEEIPFNFLFRGPPGTGKTTTARKMGKVYYDMGFLSAAKVVECSATDLIGQYVGHTGPRLQKVLDSALGKVLFIDEAYRLAGPGFAKEAVDELVDSVTKEKYKGKLIIILAGYVKDINALLAVNPGMTSRFPETIDFEPLAAQDCLELLTSSLAKRKAEIENKGKLMDISCLQYPAEPFKEEILDLFRSLAEVEGWASARDVKQLAKNVFRMVDLTSDSLRVEQDQVSEELRKMLQERLRREQDSIKTCFELPKEMLKQQYDSRSRPSTRPSISVNVSQDQANTSTPEDQPVLESESDTLAVASLGIRDAGVSDEVWEQLERDRAEEQRREEAYKKLKEAQKSASDSARKRIIQQLVEAEGRRKMEAARKAKLMAMGSCPVGYQWIKQNGGYTCAGGSHYMSDKQVDGL